MRRMLRLIGAGLGLAVGALALLLGYAHLQVRWQRRPLPDDETIRALAQAADRPVRVMYVNTASQAMARAAVLDPNQDRTPDTPYVMSHAAFVVEWADRRLLLVDLGMSKDQALAFGGMVGMMGKAEPIQPRRSVASALGAAAKRVRGIVFTHLHDDHVGGIVSLCPLIDDPVPVFMTEAQSEQPNHTTRAGLRLVRHSPCVRPVRLDEAPLMPLEGFPGVAVLHAAGHTPGSQVVIAYVGSQGYAFIGDVANHIDGVRFDVPKPFLYSLLVVPEDRVRLGEVRRYLWELHDRLGLTIVPAHDERWLKEAGIPAW